VPDPTTATREHRRIPWAWVVGNEHERRREWIAAGVFVLATVALWATSTPPFSGPVSRLPAHPSFWQIVLADRTTVGLVRMTLIMLGFFLLASIPALVVAGRWINTFGSSLTADAARSVSNSQVQLEEQLRETRRMLETVKAERNNLNEALAKALTDLNSGSDTQRRAS
jgi:low affinity Fe/Cu permease